MQRLKELIVKNKELILYVIIGGCTTVISVLSYILLTRLCHLDEVVANTISWFIALIFAFITNKTIVFESKTWQKSIVFREFTSFTAGRLLSLLIDEGIVIIGVKLLEINDIFVQLVKQVVVIILNYIISKFVFKKSEQ